MDNILQLISPLGPLINLIFCEIVFFYCLLWSSYSNVLIPLIVAYCVAFVFLDEAPWKGGREKLLASSAFCRLFRILDYCMLTTWMKEYFPIELKKTDDLDPTMGPYLFVNHPHGVFGASHMTNFSSPRPTGFENLFQGIRMHICTLNINFWIPFWREILLNRGFVSADKSTICSILLQDPSHAVAVVVGGAKESLFAIPGKNTLVLKRRKGFVKIALQTGASLVPVYAFGENNMYRQIENPVFLKIQKWVTKRLSFALVSPMGRYNTLIPYARKVVTVVGSPIPVKKTPNPSQVDIDKLHSIYIQSLTELFDEHKDKYDPDRREELTII